MKPVWLKNQNLGWLRSQTVFLTVHGSQAYGTATPQSDTDYKGVAIPPVEYFLGYHYRFEQADSFQGKDAVVYDIRKFFKLAADCNPNIIEVLWTDPRHHLCVDPIFEKVLDARHLFLSKKAKHTFSGYAMAQLKRIKTHRRWLMDPPTHKPTRQEFGLPERTVIPRNQLQAAQAQIKKQLDRWEFKHLEDIERATRQAIIDSVSKALAEMQIGSDEKFLAAGRLLGFSDNFLELLDKERRYKAAKHEFKQYQKWKTNRNPERAAMEVNYGYDAKHAMHLVRLMRMGKEILEGKGVTVKRPDAEELLAIRNGAWSYDELIEWAEQMDQEMDELYKTSTLPHKPPVKSLDQLCVDVVEGYLDTGLFF